MKRLTRGWTGHALALVAGALVTLSLAPYNLWPLGIASAALLAWLLQPLSPWAAAWRGWWYGLGLFGSGTSWVYVSIHVYGYAPVPLALFLTLLFCIGLALFCAISSYAYVRWVRDQRFGNTLGFAATWVLGEWLRSWLLTGFPWLYLGYAHLQTPLAGWAPVTGIFGLGFILALTAAVISQALQQRKLQPIDAGLVTVLWLGGWALQHWQWTEPVPERAPLKVAMVQSNIGQDLKWLPEQYTPTLQLYQRMSQPLWADYDLVIWPEAAIPGLYQRARGFLTDIEQQANAHGSSLITGIPHADIDAAGRQRNHNSIMAFGSGEGLYHKQRLVPFGEYVPLEQWLRGLIRFFDLPMSNFSAGADDQAGISAGGVTLAPFICYEIVYPDLVASWLPASDMLITISNDAWFGRSIGPLQHLQMAQMRALENGRYLLRATGTGISAIVDPRGAIVVRGDQFSREIIRGEALAMRGSTPFAVTGSWPVLVLSGLLCIRWRAFTAKIRGLIKGG